MNTEKTNIKIKNAKIYVTGGNGESFLYHKNNEDIKFTESEIADIFDLEPLTFGNKLEGAKLDHTFNTYNHGAPFIFDGVYSGEIYDDTPSVINIHLGGDARGNYSRPYICDDIEPLLSQNSFLEIELSNGENFFMDCDNSEASFDLLIDPYFVDFNEPLTSEQYQELKNLNKWIQIPVKPLQK